MANYNIWRFARGMDNAELNSAYMKISLTDLECYEMLWNVCQFTGFRLSESIVQKSDPAHVMTSSTGNPNLNFFSLFCCCYCCCCCCCCWYWCWWCYCCCFCCCYVFVCDDFCCCCVVLCCCCCCCWCCVTVLFGLTMTDTFLMFTCYWFVSELILRFHFFEYFWLVKFL